jgi:DNA primase
MPAQDWTRVVRKKRSKASSDANSIPIADVVRHFGGEVKEGFNVSVRCCMHEDSRRSAVIDTYNNLYYCHTCGKGGNAINVIMELENLGFKDAIDRANEITAGSGSPLRRLNKRQGARLPRRTWDI